MKLERLIALVMIELIILLPVSFAVVISDVTHVVTADSAEIEWKTDVETDVNYVELSEDGVLVKTMNDYQTKEHIVRFQSLLQNTFYDYKIYSKNDSDSDIEGGSFTTLDATPPEKVTGLINISIGRKHVALRWNINQEDDFDKYLIYRNNVNIANVTTAATYNDTNTTTGKIYSYRVSAIDKDGNEGVRSDPLTVRTPTPDLKPPVISDVRVIDMTDSSAKLNWSTDELATSEVYYKTTSNIETTGKIIADLTLGHIVDITGLKKGDEFYYKAGSCDDSLNCINTTERKLIVGEDFENPTINVSIKSGMYYNDNHIEVKGNLYNQRAETPESYSSIRAYVNDNIAGNIKNTGFEGSFDFGRVNLELTKDVNIVKLIAEDIGGRETTREYEIYLDFEDPVFELEEIPEITGNNTLEIKGSVSDNIGGVDLIFEYGLIEKDTIPPAAVEDFNATETNSVELTWTANTEDDFKEYVIYRSDVDDIIASTVTTKFVDNKIAGGKTYTYEIAAVDKSCNIGEKASISIKTSSSDDEEESYDFEYDCVPEEVLITEIMQDISGDFTKTLNLDKEDGYYKIKITAADKAGNEVVFEKEVKLDTKALVFIDIYPYDGAGFYRGRNSRHAKITGTVSKPGAKIKVYVNKRTTGKADDSTTAGDDGSFTFKNINLEQSFAGNITPQWIEQNSIKEIPIIEDQVFVSFTATDSTGKTIEYKGNPVRYQLVTCWSGNLSFTYIHLDEFQSPAWLSPERMQEGIELIAFAFELKYVGVGKNFNIADVKIEPLSKAESSLRPSLIDVLVKGNIRYNYSVGLIEDLTPYVVHNEDRTRWFVRFSPLKPADYMNKFNTLDKWKKFFKAINNELIFPYKIKVIATHEINGKTVSANQELCEEVAYVVDNSRIDFSRLPDFLLYDFVDFLNKTSAGIGVFLEKVKPVIDVVGGICIGSFLGSVLMQFVRRFVCAVSRDGEDDETCKGPPAIECKKANYKKMNDECLEQCFGSCAKAWRREGRWYIYYRWSCDRIFCHSTPAKWTEDKATEAELTATLEDLDISCRADQSAKGYPLIKRSDCRGLYNPDAGYSRYDGGKDCYQYTSGDKTARYVITGGAKIGSGAVTVTLKRADLDSPGTNIKPPNELTAVVIGNGDQLLAPMPYTCKTLCEHYGFDKGKSECIPVNECRKKVNNQDENIYGGPFGFTSGFDKRVDGPNDCFFSGRKEETVRDDPDKRIECCCMTEEGSGAGTVYFRPGDDQHPPGSYKDMKFNYRWWKEEPGGKTYDPRRYISGRDRSACFGRNSLIEKFPWNKETIPVLNPKTQHTSAIQCACLTGIYNRLAAIKNTMEQLMACLIQVRVTHELDAGVCKRLFSQYVCSMLWGVIQLFRNKCSPLDEYGSDALKDEPKVTDILKTGMDAIWDSVADKANELKNEYGNAKLNEMLGGGEEAIARKICLAAFGFDWGLDFESIMDAAYTTSYMSNVHALVPTREYLTFNPENGQPTYEYRANWFINPGCDIRAYYVYLVCVSRIEQNTKKGINCARVGDKENPYGCDCLNQPGEIIVAPFNPGGRTPTLRQGEPHSDENSGVLTTVDYRADHLKIVLDIDPDYKKDCLPEGYSEGEFYFPIKDKNPTDIAACTVDSVTGIFRCSSGIGLWNERGTVGFVDIVKPKEGDVYREGDSLVIMPTIYKDGPRQCLLMNVKTVEGALVTQQPKVVDIAHEGTKEYKGNEGFKLVDSINLGILGTLGVSIPPPISGTPISNDVRAPTNILISFKDGNDDGKEFNIAPDSTDKVSLDGKELKSLEKWKNEITVDSDKNLILNYKNVKVEIWGVELKGNETATYTIIAKPQTLGKQQEEWIVELSLHHLTDEGIEKEQYCVDGIDRSKPARYQDIEQKKNIRITVVKKATGIVLTGPTVKVGEDIKLRLRGELESYTADDLEDKLSKDEDKSTLSLLVLTTKEVPPETDTTVKITLNYKDGSLEVYEVTIKPSEENKPPVQG